MIDTTNIINVLVRDAALQSTAVLLVGLLVARYGVRQPARVHAVLVLTLGATIATPAISQIVRHRGWGLLTPDAGAVQLALSTTKGDPSPLPLQASGLATSAPVNHSIRAAQTQELREDFSPTHSEGMTTGATAERSSAASGEPRVEVVADRFEIGGTTSPILILVMATWLVASLVAAARLLRGAWAGTRLVANGQPCTQPTVNTALLAARERMDLGNLPIEALQSPVVKCPLIWCWGGRPRLLLPLEAVHDWSVEQWMPILCHELAHWKRRDHWAALAAEIVCCLMPWQALAWWAKRHMEQASEQACDDWTLAAGYSATDYAETLINLVAQVDPPLALTALRRRSGLAGRLRHILTQAVPRPRPGWFWSLIVLTATATLVGAVALCQRGVARAEPSLASAPPSKSKITAAKTPDAPKPTQPTAQRAVGTTAPAMPDRNVSSTAVSGTYTPGPAPPQVVNKKAIGKDSTDAKRPKRFHVQGTVLGADGQPVVGADVIWEIRYPVKPELAPPALVPVAQVKTDANGQFSCEAELVEADVIFAALLIRATGHGLRSHSTDLDKLDKPLDIRLERSYPIEGTIFTPNGEPVKDARVLVYTMQRHAAAKPGEAIDPSEYWQFWLGIDELRSGQVRPYWPAPAVTDENGQFRFDDLAPNSASVEFIVQAKDFAMTRVFVSQPGASHYPDAANWREPKFALVLENPWEVAGRFVDEKTNEPIPGVRIEVLPVNYGRGPASSDRMDAVSDQDGRYALRLGSVDLYYVTVYAPLGYAGINTSFSAKTLKKTADKGRKLDYEVKLRRGMILRGRVVAADTGDPVEGADVMYKPERNRTLGANDEFYPVKTTADGAFEVTGADGKGFLLVDAPKMGFYRLVVDDARLPKYREVLCPHGLLEIDVPSENQTEPFVISLKRGPELVLRALDPSGKPVKQLSSGCVAQEMNGFFNGVICSDGTFRLEAAEPGRQYRVFLFSKDAMAGAVAEVVAPADGHAIDVVLQPCATIRGRYVYDSGVPVPEIANFSHFRIDPTKEPDANNGIHGLPFYDNLTSHHSPKKTTDADGNFELNDIVPGVFMYLHLNYQFADGKEYHALGMLAPGEVKELGDLVIQP